MGAIKWEKSVEDELSFNTHLLFLLRVWSPIRDECVSDDGFAKFPD